MIRDVLEDLAEEHQWTPLRFDIVLFEDEEEWRVKTDKIREQSSEELWKSFVDYMDRRVKDIK